MFIVYDNEKYTASVSESSYIKHGESSCTAVYLIDFESAGKKENTYKLEIVIR